MTTENHAPAFLQELSEDAVLEASVALEPVVGKAAIIDVIMGIVHLFSEFKPTFREAAGNRNFAAYEAKLKDGQAVKGMVILTRNEAGLVSHVLLGHAPNKAVVKMVAALAAAKLA